MSSAGWLSPTDPWDRHSRPLAQRALRDARATGWWLKKSAGRAKAWGVITCGDPALPSRERCSASVLSTSGPADGSATAKAIDAIVRQCPHQRRPSDDAIAKAGKCLELAEKCLVVVDALLVADGHRDLLEDYLNQSIEESDRADRLLALALEEELEVDRAEEEAATAAAALGVVGSDRGQLLDKTRALVSEASSLVEGHQDREARILRARCTEVRDRATQLHRLLV